MSEDSKRSTPLRDVLPRNTTARADYLVPGNPMIARPESGVGNAHPGLEFDVRALERHFLPGLVFDFQYGAGAKLVDMDSSRLGRACAITAADLAHGVFLWAVAGRFGDDPDKRRVVPLLDVDGYMVIRRLMDLEEGDISVLVGSLPRTSVEVRKAQTAIAALADQPQADAFERIDQFVFERFDGRRAKFLDSDGVIDPDLIPPGELTSNLCSPWQWDFADCYCFYWASSKPDVVIGISGTAQVLNFQRDRNNPENIAPAITSAAWRGQNISEPDMITGWADLPVVTAEREGVVPRQPLWPKIDAPMSLSEIADQLQSLAGLEHALCIEYLYAKFSLDAPRKAPSGLNGPALHRYQAAREVFNIAVDEMRHLRWVNEALWLLERPPSLERVKIIGQDLRRFFELRPLLPQVLDEFIGIEAPRSILNDDPQQLDSVYSRILVSLNELGDGPDHELVLRLMQLMKTIIDEGENHWDRFQRVKERLAGTKPVVYLRFLTAPGDAPREPWNRLQDLCDAYYDLLLQSLYITFRLGRKSRGFWLSVSHHAMFALDDAGYLLSEQKFAPRFKLPSWTDASTPRFAAATQLGFGGHGPKFVKDVVGSEDAIEALFADVEGLLDHLSKSSNTAARKLAADHRTQMAKMKSRILEEFHSNSAAHGHGPEMSPHG